MDEASSRGGPGSAESAVPGMPVIRPSERSANPYPVLEGPGHTLGWQFRPDQRGGPVFVLLRRGGLGMHKVLYRFPLTEAGWSSAWNVLEREDPQAAQKIRLGLAEREREQRELDSRLGIAPEVAALDFRSIASLRQVTLLGGYGLNAAVMVGQLYDARFLDDRLAVFPAHSWEPCAEVAYSQIENVEIGGPGLVKTGGGFVGGGFGVVGALDGMAIASVLNALTTRTSITTIVRVQGTGCELFLLHTRSTPEKLRIEMSPALGAIRAARAEAAQETTKNPLATEFASQVQQLAKLAEMLQAGLLTREEFDQLKAKLMRTQP